MAQRVDRSRPMTVRRFATAADADSHYLDYWREIPDRERVMRVWTLSQELWQLRGETIEPGLCRSVASVRRR